MRTRFRSTTIAVALPLAAGLIMSSCSGAGGGGGGGGGDEAKSINVLMVGNPQMVDIQKLTADSFTNALGALDATAPAEIAADVEAETEWFRTRWSDVTAEYDYDIRTIHLKATPEDLAVFNRTHPDVLVHTSRTTAYEEQICDA